MTAGRGVEVGAAIREQGTEYGVCYGAGTDTDQPKDKVLAQRIKTFSCTKGERKGFMVSETSENKKLDNWKPA